MKQHIKAISEYLKKDKLNPAEWEERGLNPSPQETIDYMISVVNDCCQRVIDEIKKGASREVIHSVMSGELNKVDRNRLDTEESEMVVEYFYQLSDLINIDLRKELNIWLYGFDIP